MSLPLLPTITETLEDLPVHPSSLQQPQGSHSLDDYMSSIQALARPVEDTSYGPVRFQRSPRQHQLSKTARVSSRTPRTSRAASLPSHSTEEFSLRMSRERDSRGKDPVDWLFGQIRTWREMLLLSDIMWVLCWSEEISSEEPQDELLRHGSW